MKVRDGIIGLTLGMALIGGAWAQTAGDAAKPAADAMQPVQTFYLKHVSDTREANEIYNTIRSLLPKGTVVEYADSQKAIFVSGTTEQLALAQRIINDLDRPGGDTLPVRTFYLKSASQPNDGNEIQTAIRSTLPPDVKIYYVSSQSALILRATPEEIALAEKLINDLDRPRKTYRLTYTVTEMDSGKRVSSQHFAMIVAAGQRTTLKQGIKVPYATVSAGVSGSAQNNQIQYVDVGMNFDATLDEVGNGARLKSKVEQSSVAEEKSGVGAQDPVIRQTALEGMSFLTVGKPLMLGSVDVPGTTRHLDVEVLMEQVP